MIASFCILAASLRLTVARPAAPDSYAGGILPVPERFFSGTQEGFLTANSLPAIAEVELSTAGLSLQLNSNWRSCRKILACRRTIGFLRAGLERV